jgi:hypothetical protein
LVSDGIGASAGNNNCAIVIGSNASICDNTGSSIVIGRNVISRISGSDVIAIGCFQLSQNPNCSVIISPSASHAATLAVNIGHSNINNDGCKIIQIGTDNQVNVARETIAIGQNNGFAGGFPGNQKMLAVGGFNFIRENCSQAYGYSNEINCGATGTVILGNNNVGGTGSGSALILGYNNATNCGASNCYVVIGSGNTTTNANLSAASCGPSVVIGHNAQEISNGVNGGSVVIGTNTLINGNNTEGVVAIGYGTCVCGSNAAYSTAIGFLNVVSGSRSVALGRQTTVSGEDAFGVGWVTTAAGNGSIALGSFAGAYGAGAVNVGYQSQAYCDNSVTLGRCSISTENGAVAIGLCNTACHTNAAVIGNNLASEKDATTHVNHLIAYGQGASKFHAVGNITGNVTLNWDNGNNQSVTLTGAVNLGFSNPISGANYGIAITQGGVGGYTITWTGVLWANATPPVLSAAVGAVDFVNLVYDGTNYYGSYGNNFA